MALMVILLGGFSRNGRKKNSLWLHRLIPLHRQIQMHHLIPTHHQMRGMLRNEQPTNPYDHWSNSNVYQLIAHFSTAPAPTAPSRKRGPRHNICGMRSTKKYKIDSDYEETDEEYADEYELAIDEIIRRNQENRPVEYKCVHSFMKSSDWQNCKRIADSKSS